MIEISYKHPLCKNRTRFYYDNGQLKAAKMAYNWHHYAGHEPQMNYTQDRDRNQVENRKRWDRDVEN